MHLSVYTDVKFILIIRFSLRLEKLEEKLHYRIHMRDFSKNGPIRSREISPHFQTEPGGGGVPLFEPRGGTAHCPHAFFSIRIRPYTNSIAPFLSHTVSYGSP